MKLKIISATLSVLFLVSCSSNTKEAKVIGKEEAKPTAQTTKPKVSEQKKEASKRDKEKSETAQKSDSNTSVTSVDTHKSQKETKKMPQDAVHNAFKKAETIKTSPKLAKFYTIFQDGAKIAPKDGKPLLLVFGQPTDPYTQKLQDDVTSNKSLAKAITETTTPVYINAAAKKLHKFMHNGELMDVDTKTLISIYHLEATPTLIFMDEKSQSIFMVPGYMPPKQFEVTLQFVKDGVWRGKDRKNGEVYKTLKEYYLAHGIKVGEPKK